MEWIKSLLTPENLSLVTGFAVNLLGVILLLIFGLILAKVLKKSTLKALKKSKLDETLSKALANAVYWLVFVFVVLGCLSIFGIETTSVAAIIGAAGLAIGLAFQGTLSNLAAGVMLIIFRPFKVGDVITVSGDTGGVKEIRPFDTILDTPDNRRIIIPNSKIYGNTILNVSYHENRRVDVSVGVSYDANMDETRKTLEACIKSVPNVLDEPQSAVIMAELDAAAVTWSVRVWCPRAEYFAVREALIGAIKRDLDAAKIEIPFNQIVVHQAKN
ncbi:MAG: mechanosensitive ion channel domain-containing protein [Bradymonadales bacterium]